MGDGCGWMDQKVNKTPRKDVFFFEGCFFMFVLICNVWLGDVGGKDG